MCGRYKLTVSWSEIVRLYKLTNSVNLAPRYNIAPSQAVLGIVYDAEVKRRVGAIFRWGLIPSWAQDVEIGYSLVNAKAETVAVKPAYRDAFKHRRCIIPADGFYEWQETGESLKQPYAIVMKDRRVFGFAGLWERWTDKASGEVVRSCTIITTEPNALCAPIHNRMPAILDLGDYARWLGVRPVTANELRAMLQPYPANEVEAVKIGPRIGNVKNDEPSLVKPSA